MIKNRLSILLAAVIVCSPALGQNTGDKPLSEADLLKQIDSLGVSKTTPPPAKPVASSAAAPILNSSSANGDLIKPPKDPASVPVEGADPNAQPPTEITALEATFDNRANVAVFIGSVFVKDPQFNVDCDKLTAFLKHEDNTEVKPVGQKTSATPVALKPIATPAPLKPPASPAPAGAAPAPGVKKQTTGLDKAIAVTTSERRVIITQDKVDADGNVTHGIGISDRAEYFASTGDIFLYGMPDVTQGTNRCIATAPETWMKLTRDGRMEAHGPHKTIIIDNERDKDNNKSAAQ